MLVQASRRSARRPGPDSDLPLPFVLTGTCRWSWGRPEGQHVFHLEIRDIGTPAKSLFPKVTFAGSLVEEGDTFQPTAKGGLFKVEALEHTTSPADTLICRRTEGKAGDRVSTAGPGRQGPPPSRRPAAGPRLRSSRSPLPTPRLKK